MDYGGIFMDPANFYHVSLLKGQLDETVEAKYVDYLVNHPQGIYYIGYPGRLKDLPEVFKSRQTIRFLASVRMLAEYKSYKKYSQPVLQWLEDNKSPDGNWAFDTKAKDNIYLPLSDSWRKAETRIADSTAFVKYCILPLA